MWGVRVILATGGALTTLLALTAIGIRLASTPIGFWAVIVVRSAIAVLSVEAALAYLTRIGARRLGIPADAIPLWRARLAVLALGGASVAAPWLLLPLIPDRILIQIVLLCAAPAIIEVGARLLYREVRRASVAAAIARGAPAASRSPRPAAADRYQ